MTEIVSAPFFSANPVFDRAAYAKAVGRTPDDPVVSAMLTQHVQAGSIRRLARGLYASVPRHADAKTWTVDRFLAASRLRSGGVIAYHSAMELHGYAYTDGAEVQVLAEGRPGVREAADFSCRFVRAPEGGLPADAVTAVDRLGMQVRLTTLERTIVDLFDRYDLAGGAEELFNSLDLVVRVDAAALVRHAGRSGNAQGVAALGYWLEREADRLGVQTTAIETLRTRAPRQAGYALGAKRGEGLMAKGWNVILPAHVVERRFEGH